MKPLRDVHQTIDRRLPNIIFRDLEIAGKSCNILFPSYLPQGAEKNSTEKIVRGFQFFDKQANGISYPRYAKKIGEVRFFSVGCPCPALCEIGNNLVPSGRQNGGNVVSKMVIVEIGRQEDGAFPVTMPAKDGQGGTLYRQSRTRQ